MALCPWTWSMPLSCPIHVVTNLRALQTSTVGIFMEASLLLPRLLLNIWPFSPPQRLEDGVEHFRLLIRAGLSDNQPHLRALLEPTQSHPIRTKDTAIT